MSSRTDRTLLVSKTISGDREAFEQLLLSQDNAIIFRIRSMAKCAEDAEDIRQEVAMRLYQKIGTLKHPEAFDGWLDKLILRECFRHFAAQKPIVYRDNLCEYEENLAETNTDCLPFAHAEHLESYAEINAALNNMPKRISDMVILHYEAGMRYREIANVLGVTINSVASGLFRARKQLRKELL